MRTCSGGRRTRWRRRWMAGERATSREPATLRYESAVVLYANARGAPLWFALTSGGVLFCIVLGVVMLLSPLQPSGTVLGSATIGTGLGLAVCWLLLYLRPSLACRQRL